MDARLPFKKYWCFCRRYSATNLYTAFPNSDYEDPQPGPRDAIFVAMSGGVDSSVVASLMASRYQNVTGVYMTNWTMPRTPRREIQKRSQMTAVMSKDPAVIARLQKEELEKEKQDLESGLLCSETDWSDVQAVCSQLKIPSIRLSFEKDYWTDVFEPMLRGYAAGQTPNPDVNCNKFIKFGRLYDKIEQMAEERGAKRWWLVSGHYARTGKHIFTGQTHLLRPLDTKKDQTYYLSNIDYQRLPNILFPLHKFTKSEIRQLAVDRGLATAYRPDSQGLCFVAPSIGANAATKAHQEGKPIIKSSGYSHFRDFLAEYIETQPGDVVTVDGEVVGKHEGLWNFTIGQRSGVSMPQGNPDYHGVWYVVDKRASSNEIVIAQGRVNKWSFSTAVTCSDWTWMTDSSEIEKLPDLALEQKIQARIRSLSTPVPVSNLEILPNDKVKIEFVEQQHGVAHGQTTVLYYGDRLIGGGPVEERTLPENISF